MDAGLPSSVAGTLLDASIAGSAAIVCAWVACRYAALPPRWQAVVWWAASLKLLLAMVTLPAVRIPLLPAPEPALEHAARAMARVAPAPEMVWRGPSPSAGQETAMAARGARDTAIRVLAWLWMAGVAYGGARLVITHGRLRRVRRRAVPADAEVTGIVRTLAHRARLSGAPLALISEDVDVPQIVGAWHPAIVLPASAVGAWGRDDLRMAVAHELAHIRRRDLVWGWIPVLAESVFFFHPLARLAAREYVVARESACDADALAATHASPDEYGRLLVRLGVRNGGYALAAQGASTSRSVLSRRLKMLVHTRTQTTHRTWVVLAVAAAALVPLQLTARDAEPAAIADAPGPSARSFTADESVGRLAPSPAPAAARAAAQSGANRTTAASKPDDDVERRARAAAEIAAEAAQAAAQGDAEAARQAADVARETAARIVEQERETRRAVEAETRARAEIQGLMDEQVRTERERAAREELQHVLRELEALEARREVLRARQSVDGQREVEAQIGQMQEAAARARKAVQARQVVREPTGDRLQQLREQLQVIVARQESLMNQQQALAKQQQALAEQLVRVREALEAAGR